MSEGSTPIYSRFDSTIGVTYFNVAPIADPELIAAVIASNEQRKESPDHRDEYTRRVMGIAWARHYSLMVHEWAHTLQALAYPALYLRCLREFSSMFTVLDALKETPGDCPVPFQPSEPWGTELVIPTQRLRLSLSEDGLPVIEFPPPGPEQPNDLSETDLLEDAASLFQYKAEIGSEGSHRSYCRWLNERRDRYSRTFDFLSTILSPVDAYVAMPSLVMAASMTNWPVHGFASLLAMTVKEGPKPPSEMGTDLYWLFLEKSLEYSFPTGIPEPRHPLEEESAHFHIDREAMRKLAAAWPSHPLSPLVELAWGEEENIHRLRDTMLHPFKAFSRERRASKDWIDPYGPPVAAFRLLDERLSVGDSVLLVSDTVLASEPAGFPGMNWPRYLIELMRLKAFVFASVTPFTADSGHNCPHVECRFHRFGMCRNWIHIPAQFEECIFPAWLEGWTGRRLNSDSEMLVRTEDSKEEP